MSLGDSAGLSVVPANQSSCDDLLAVFGPKGYTGRCLCQKFRTTGEEWWYDPIPREERVFRLRQQTDCGFPDADGTTGLVAYLDGQPAGWCSIECPTISSSRPSRWLS